MLVALTNLLFKEVVLMRMLIAYEGVQFPILFPRFIKLFSCYLKK